MADERIALIFEESRRKLDQQATVLDNLRARAGLLLSAAAIASSFLGVAALGDGDKCAWSWLAIAALLAVGWWTIRGVLWPRQKAWIFSHDIRKLEGYVDGQEREWDIDAMRLAVAETHQDFWDKNADVLDGMFRAFRFAAVALLVEVVFWLLDLGFCGG